MTVRKKKDQELTQLLTKLYTIQEDNKINQDQFLVIN